MPVEDELSGAIVKSVFSDTITSMVVNTIEKSVNISNIITETGTIEDLEAEAMRQEISLKMAKEQAKVSQEIAIARRIENAEEVIIEEYYDTSGDASVGLKSTKNAVSFGVNGSGKYVTKRVYKFKGWHDIELKNDNDSNETVEVNN